MTLRAAAPVGGLLYCGYCNKSLNLNSPLRPLTECPSQRRHGWRFVIEVFKKTTLLLMQQDCTQTSSLFYTPPPHLMRQKPTVGFDLVFFFFFFIKTSCDACLKLILFSWSGPHLPPSLYDLPVCILAFAVEPTLLLGKSLWRKRFGWRCTQHKHDVCHVFMCLCFSRSCGFI